MISLDLLNKNLSTIRSDSNIILFEDIEVTQFTQLNQTGGISTETKTSMPMCRCIFVFARVNVYHYNTTLYIVVLCEHTNA